MDVDQAFEVQVKLHLNKPSKESIVSLQKAVVDCHGIIDIQFDSDKVVLHYQNNIIGIDSILNMMHKNNIIYSKTLMNRFKIALQQFVDTNAMSNANSEPGCCAKASDICKKKIKDNQKQKEKDCT